VCDVAGRPAALDDTIKEAPLFYGTFAPVTVVGAGLVLIPGISLVPILVGTQVVNAVLLLPLLFYMSGIAQSRNLMGEFAVGRLTASAYWVVIALVVVSIGTFALLTIT
jgi:Mn2+/Fe2+ NRAMP family transporter